MDLSKLYIVKIVMLDAVKNLFKASTGKKIPYLYFMYIINF